MSALFICFFYFMGLNNAVVIKGQVRDATTGSPVAKAHVYLIKGEVEQFSDSLGRFELHMVSNKAILYFDHPYYQLQQQQVTNDEEVLIVALQKK